MSRFLWRRCQGTCTLSSHERRLPHRGGGGRSRRAGRNAPSLGAEGTTEADAHAGGPARGSRGRGGQAPVRAAGKPADRLRESAQSVPRGDHAGQEGQAGRDRRDPGGTPSRPRVHHPRGGGSDGTLPRHAGDRGREGDERHDRAPGMSAAGGIARREAGLPGVLGDASGAIADLGVLVPLAAALILVNGLDAGAVFVGAGLLAIGAGAWFRVPFPVQPLKALTAVAVARELSPDVIHAAGLELAGFLLLLSIGHVADAVARVFVKPVVRALQLGVGGLLVITAAKLVLDPPDVFRGTPDSPWPILLGFAALGCVAFAAHRHHYWAALALFGTGVAVTVVTVSPELGAISLRLPKVGLPSWPAYGAA